MTYGTPDLNGLLDQIARALDLPPELHRQAESQYKAVGQFLAAHERTSSWDVYPQGSFRLGTVVLPRRADEHFDIDLVCLRGIDKTSTTQAGLKAEVGRALEDYVDAVRGQAGFPVKLDESRRAWQLEYEEAFHLDVLPAVPVRVGAGTDIWLTDKDLREWQPSNPIAYADWFLQQMVLELSMRKATLARELRKSVEEIPDYEVKTVLQQVVQLLKSHRDAYFVDDPDDRPPSILITTLAARAYQGHQQLVDAVVDTAHGMPAHIEARDGRLVVSSPVSDENFADKWNEYPQRKKKFAAWLDQVQRDVDAWGKGGGLDAVFGPLGQRFGEKAVRKAFTNVGMETRVASAEGRLGVAGAAAGLTAVSRGGSAVRPHTFYGGRP